MRVPLLIVSATFLGTLATGVLCASLFAQAATVDLTGTWHGTSSDTWHNVNAPASNGMVVTWVLSQTGSTVSGTAATAWLNGNDGSCSGCHRLKSGTVSGSLSGTTLTMTMDLPGHPGDPSPICNATFSTTAPGTITITPLSIVSQPASQRILTGQTVTLKVTVSAPDQLIVPYDGLDSCEGLFDGGSLPMTRESPRSYQWYSGPSGTTSAPIAGATGDSYTTPPITANATFWVRVAGGSGMTTDSTTATLTPGHAFTDDILIAGTSIIKVVHIQELRTRIDALRLRFGLPAYPYADATLTAGATVIQVQHIVDLRSALAEAYSAAGLAVPVYTDSSLAGMTIKQAHITELRSAVASIE